MKKSFILFSIALLLICSCTLDVQPEVEINNSISKIINTKSVSSADLNYLLVKVSDSETDFNSFLANGAESVTPVFMPTPGKEELERQFGLDRWYKVTSAIDDIEQLAIKLSLLQEVSLIQYPTLAKKASDCIVYPYDPFTTLPSIATKGESGFNDPYFPDQWNFNNLGNPSIATTAYKGGDINVKNVWSELTTGDPSIIVAVVDEGVVYSHNDLRPNMWVNQKEYDGKEGVDDDGNGYVDDIYGYNFISDGAITWNKEKDSGHGSHCAGVISAVNNNGIGISSVAGGSGKNDGVKIMSCQIFDNKRGGDAYNASRAIKYAADMGASIISCSFGIDGGSFISDGAYKRRRGIEADAIYYFEATKNNTILDGGIAVFAAGNESVPYAGYPGALNDIISVSAFGPDYLPTYYTNYGPGCNIVAPGGEAFLPPWTSEKGMILSTLPFEKAKSGYGYMQGTSMACPHVSGIVALGLSYAKKIGKTFTVEEFKRLILTSANDFDKRLVGSKTYYNNAKPPLELQKFAKQMGTGSIDTWLMLMKIEGTPSLVAKYGEKQWLDISPYFGTSSVNLTYLSLDISEKDKAALGLVENPYIKYGRIYIHPTKVGSAKITINAIAGGTVIGGDDAIGGMEISQDVSIIVRSFKTNNGGWL